MAAPRLFIGHICLLLELHISIWAISRGRVSIQRKFTRRLQASGLAIELPTRVNATGPGIQARGAVQSQSGLGRGRALPAGPLSAPPLFLAQGSMYSGWLCALRIWDQDAGPAASTNRERGPACPALHYHVGSCLPHSSGLVVGARPPARRKRGGCQRGGLLRRQVPRSAPTRDPDLLNGTLHLGQIQVRITTRWTVHQN